MFLRAVPGPQSGRSGKEPLRRQSTIFRAEEFIRRCGVLPSTPHSSGFARPASGAFYEAISLATFYEIIKYEWTVELFLTETDPRKGDKIIYGGR